MDIHEYKDKITGKPDYFAYFGELDLDAWGTMLTVHRDSEILDRSNWRVISNDMLSKFPEGVTIERSSHWAVGWVDELKVNTDSEDALDAAYEWYLKLDDYIVVDEDDYSALEQEELEESFDSHGRREVEDWLTENNVSLDFLGAEKDYNLFWLWCDCYYYNGEMYASDDAMEDAIRELRLGNNLDA